MIKNYKHIILSYGLFLGWLLSFPYNGPVLGYLVSLYNLEISSISLIYIAFPAFFLIFFSLLEIKEVYAKRIMLFCISFCIFGNTTVFIFPPSFWYPVFALMGICSVMYIIGWSYFYTMEIPIKKKMSIMSLVIIWGNIIYYLVKIALPYINSIQLMVVMSFVLVGSLWSSIKISITNKIDLPLEKELFPQKLILVICIFLFLIKINHGLSFHAIQPSFDNLFKGYFTYYGMLPYIITLIIMYFYGSKMSGILPVFLGTSLLGLAYLSFSLMKGNWYNYFFTETLLQSGRALLDLFIWTLLGIAASIYGRPLKICSYGFLANLSAVFVGGLLGVQLLGNLDNYYLISAIFSIGIIFISILIVFWLNEFFERDLMGKIINKASTNNTTDNKLIYISLPQKELLTPREGEVGELLIQGYSNKEIAKKLSISENTLKTHTRNIYSKLNVSNKRELLQISLSNNSCDTTFN